jgi:tRNA A-37 threonylcarbamoyl transferase component Bud32
MPADGIDAAGRDNFVVSLRRMGLLAQGEAVCFSLLTGGVSSDIVRADLASGPICLKRALPKLKVEADWQAPIERNRWEVHWMRVAQSIVPGAVPLVLGDDETTGTFAMQFLEPVAHPVWKSQLRDGAIDPGFAGQVGTCIARIHTQTAHRDDMAKEFATDHIFFPIRLEPYLAAAARAHPDCAAQLLQLIDVTGRTKTALVHGDVSPKNILIGLSGPVFLDAECAWYGDPAFDLAFCLNHLLLKCAWRPQWTARFLDCFDALARAYRAEVNWEPVAQLEQRAAHLLPGLLLARVDGKSPVEYITQEWQRTVVRGVAKRFLLTPTDKLAEIRGAWNDALQSLARSNTTLFNDA